MIGLILVEAVFVLGAAAALLCAIIFLRNEEKAKFSGGSP